MSDIFVMCDYPMRRFYFLNSERHAVVLSTYIVNAIFFQTCKFEKNIAFEKESSNIKLTNMALSK